MVSTICGIIQYMPQSAPPTTKRPKRSYTDEEVANALVAIKTLGGNVYKAAKKLGIPYYTLREWWLNNRRQTEKTRLIHSNTEKSARDWYTEIESSLLQRMAKPEVIEQMKGLDLAKAANLVRNSIQLLSGQPTSIVEERTIDSRQVLVLLMDSCGSNGLPDSAPLERNVTPAEVTP